MTEFIRLEFVLQSFYSVCTLWLPEVSVLNLLSNKKETFRFMVPMRRLLFIVILLLCTAGLPVKAQQILVSPYLQPGNGSTASREQKVLIWQTDSIPATFNVEFAAGNLGDVKKISTAKVSSVQLKLGGHTTILYRALLAGLKFDADYTYRVKKGSDIVLNASFATRTKRNATRFAVFGDCGTGSPEQKAIAYQIAQQKPQFVLIPGDIVYNRGMMNEYQARYFPIYNGTETSLEKGASLMKSIPFYTLLGNHDVLSSNLDKIPGGLAYFYYNEMPANAPLTERPLEVTGKAETVKAYEAATKGRYPGTANYSFEYDNVHITCLDANVYTNPLDQALINWMREDIASSTADWKMVSFHEPGFNSSLAHDDSQIMRLLCPVMEELGVDMVLNGHVHNYQRTRPIRFAPKMNEKGDQFIVSKAGNVDGVVTLDQKFDGITNKKPDGIIYIVTGAGGAALYDPELSNKPELWKHETKENWVPFTVKLISDVHSFTMIETEGKKLTLRQINVRGEVIDEIHLTK